MRLASPVTIRLRWIGDGAVPAGDMPGYVGRADGTTSVLVGGQVQYVCIVDLLAVPQATTRSVSAGRVHATSAISPDTLRRRSSLRASVGAVGRIVIVVCAFFCFTVRLVARHLFLVTALLRFRHARNSLCFRW